MEKRSPFNKGKQGHPEYKNPYLIRRERKEDRWRFRAMGGFLLMFASFVALAPHAQFGKADVLSADAKSTQQTTVNYAQVNVDGTKKALLQALSSYRAVCGENKKCLLHVEQLMNRALAARTAEEITAASKTVSEFGLALSLQTLYKKTHPTF